MKTAIKIWMAFVALLAVAVVGLTVWWAAALIQAGPEGLGLEIGEFLRGVDEGRKP